MASPGCEIGASGGVTLRSLELCAQSSESKFRSIVALGESPGVPALGQGWFEALAPRTHQP